MIVLAGRQQLGADQQGEDAAEQERRRGSTTRYITPIRLWSRVKSQDSRPWLVGEVVLAVRPAGRRRPAPAGRRVAVAMRLLLRLLGERLEVRDEGGDLLVLEAALVGRHHRLVAGDDLRLRARGSTRGCSSRRPRTDWPSAMTAGLRRRRPGTSGRSRRSPSTEWHCVQPRTLVEHARRPRPAACVLEEVGRPRRATCSNSPGSWTTTLASMSEWLVPQYSAQKSVVLAGLGRLEPDLGVAAGDDVLLDAEGRDEEAVDHVLGRSSRAAPAGRPARAGSRRRSRWGR